MTESERLADELHRVFHGHAWHGPALRALLRGVTARQALAHPLPRRHSIWELVLHIHAWESFTLEAIARGKAMPQSPAMSRNYPQPGGSAPAWRQDQKVLFATHDELCRAVAAVAPGRFARRVPGRRYDFGHLMHGIAHHGAYHTGQIALLKRALKD